MARKITKVKILFRGIGITNFFSRKRPSSLRSYYEQNFENFWWFFQTNNSSKVGTGSNCFSVKVARRIMTKYVLWSSQPSFSKTSIYGLKGTSINLALILNKNIIRRRAFAAASERFLFPKLFCFLSTLYLKTCLNKVEFHFAFSGGCLWLLSCSLYLFPSLYLLQFLKGVRRRTVYLTLIGPIETDVYLFFFLLTVLKVSDGYVG